MPFLRPTKDKTTERLNLTQNKKELSNKIYNENGIEFLLITEVCKKIFYNANGVTPRYESQRKDMKQVSIIDNVEDNWHLVRQF